MTALQVDVERLEILKKERATILAAIDDLPANDTEEQQERGVDYLLADYNRIMEAIDRIPSLEVRDPLRILPLEVWIQVIIWSLPSAEYMSALLLLTMVSADWRGALISTPMLWTHIHIDPFTHDCWAVTTVFLHLSRGMALSITAPMLLDSILNTVSTIIKPHASRINELIFLESTSEIDAGDLSIEPLERMVEALGFPEEISILRMQKQDHVLVQVADLSRLLAIAKPRIRVLENIVLAASAFRLLSPNLPLLEEAFVDGNVDNVLALLDGYPTLKLLQVFRIDVADGDSEDTTVRRTAIFERLSTKVQLKEFRLYCGDSVEEFPLLAIFFACSPVLQDVSLSVRYSLMQSLVFTIGEMKSLRYLAITVSEGSYDSRITPLETPAVILPNSSLQCLTLVTSARQGYAANTIHHTNLLDALFRILATQFTGVTDVYLDFRVTPVTSDILNDYLSNLSCVRSLYLELPTYDYQPPSTLLRLPCLEKLTVNDSRLTSSCVIPNILKLKTPWLEPSPRSPEANLANVRTLEISAATQYQAEHALEASRLPHLVRIKVHIHEFNDRVILPSFPFLTTIHLSSYHLTYPQCTLFCVSLLYNPHQYPCLESLGFGAMPELDMLFLMLERRNFLADSSISRIRKMTLPALGRHLMGPLKSVLRGFYSLRPSLRQLSIEGTREVLFDENIPGCRLCIQQELAPCDEPVIVDPPSRRGMDWRDQDKLRDPYNFELPAPPHSLSPRARTWIEGRSSRVDAWSGDFLKWNFAQRRRAFSCHSKRHFEVEISDSDV